MIFFDCHDLVQLDIYDKFVNENIISDNTIIALHDTNLHYPPHRVNHHESMKNIVCQDGHYGYAHQPVERHMTNVFKS